MVDTTAMEIMATVLFGKKEAAAILGISVAHLDSWVSAGVVVPSVKGKPARNQGNKFGIKQMMGMATAIAFKFTRSQARDEIKRQEGWTWPAIEAELHLRQEEHTEEAMVRSRGDSTTKPIGPIEQLPSDTAYPMVQPLISKYTEVRNRLRDSVLE
jgi:hypothetical protein